MRSNRNRSDFGDQKELWIALGLAAVSVAVFWPAMHVGFLYLDDDVNVTANLFVRQGLTPRGLSWAFSTFRSDLWNPLLWISYMLDFQLFGLDPVGFHMTNLLLHAANAVLVFWILRKMTGRVWESAFAAGFFALHPLRVESVAWVAERKDVLYAFFLFSALAAYATWVRARAAWKYAALLALYACSLMSKGLAVVFPLLLLTLDWWPLDRLSREERRDRIIEKIPLFIMAAADGAMNIVARRSVLAYESAVPLWRRIFSAPLFFVAYLEKTFWPLELPLYYTRPSLTMTAASVASATAVLALITAAAWRLRRRCPALWTGWLWFFLSLLPICGVLEGLFANRYSYVPQIGIAIALAWGASECARHWRLPAKVIVPCAIGFLFCLAALTRRELGYWSDQRLLYERSLEAAPENELFHNLLGVYLAKHGEPDAAERHFREAIELKPGYTYAWDNLGLLLEQQGRIPEAVSAWNNLGFVFERQGRIPDAIAAYRHALKIAPRHAQAAPNLSRLCADAINSPLCAEANIR